MNHIKRNLIGVILFTALPLISLAQTVPLNSAVPAPSCMDFSAPLNLTTVGASDPTVQLQLLNLQLALGYEGLTVDSAELSKFGKSTRAAVKAFQEKYNADILAPFGLKTGTGYPGAITRLKLQALYGCRVSAPSAQAQATTSVSLAVTNLVLDNNGVSATFCNLGKNDLSTAPFRIRLNGINRDFEAIGAQKAGACTTDTWKYDAWGLTYDPGSTYTAVGLIDPNGVYKNSKLQFPLSGTSVLLVPALPGAHLSVRSVILKSTGVQATFCNLGTIDLSNFPVRVTVNGTTKLFDIPGAYKSGKCAPTTWTYDNWGLTYTPGTTYNATVAVDPNNAYNETNEFDNVATVIGTP